MLAGKLKHYITFKKPGNYGRDASGEKVMTFATVFSCYARVEPVSTYERDLAEQAHSARTHRVTCRPCPELVDLDGSWIIEYGTRIFSIEGIRNIDEADRTLEVVCVEGLKQV